MKVEQLRSFIVVAQEESYSRAAQRLYLTQPTVSNHIISLEAELGLRLVNRSTKKRFFNC